VTLVPAYSIHSVTLRWSYPGHPVTMRSMSEEKVLSVADDARDMILELRDNEPGDSEFGLLIEVTGISGGQFQYELSFVPLDTLEDDRVIERHGDLPIAFRQEDIPKLQGASLELLPDGLAMNNPNQPASPAMAAKAVESGDLTGPLAEQVMKIIEEQINPGIAAHGGGAELVSVEGSVAFLKLQGGCVGCGMAQMTLKQGIERILVDSIPELTTVVDVTDHASGTDPYYQPAKK